jgi:DNA-binding MarR family transcriptional regulator
VTTPRFDEVIHPSTRLSIVALLVATDWAEFSFVRDRLGMSDSALSKQFATLEEAGYITVERTLSNHRRRVRVAMTEAGRQAFDGHVAALQAVIANAQAGQSRRASATPVTSSGYGPSQR